MSEKSKRAIENFGITNNPVEAGYIIQNGENLDFSGKNPNFIPKYKIENLTTFRKEVIDKMLKIPYGQVVTYKDKQKSKIK